MLQLYKIYLYHVTITYQFVYIVISKLLGVIFFYPQGIMLSILLLIWIFYICVISSLKIIKYYNNILYLYREFYLIIFSKNIYMLVELYKLISLLTNLLYFYAEYLYIFNLKRLEFYIFIFFVFCIFI